MQIFRYVEQGSIEFLWISATNPAVSMPELPRIRDILARPELFLVVQDLYLTETAQYADVVLPAAGWGEKTGTFTNVNRTVHLSEKAVDPPGEARSDLDIFLDYARRMDFTTLRRRAAAALDRAGGRFRGLEGVLPRPALRLHRHQLRAAPRRQRHPVALQRGHPDGTDPAVRGTAFSPQTRTTAKTYGHDLLTGATVGRRRPSAPRAPAAGPMLKTRPVPAPARGARRGLPAAVHHRAHRLPLPHPHQDGPVPALDRAAPKAWVEMAPEDADRLGIAEGDLVRVTSRRGRIEVPGPDQRHPARHGLRPVPLRLLGHRRRPG